ncbi:hypothetical protein HDZ31DRAFT_60495 [Schizophyllum fasciatum]
MAQIPAPNPATPNAPGPVVAPTSHEEQKVAITYVIDLSSKLLYTNGTGAVTVNHFLAGLEYMYRVLCERQPPKERAEILPQYIGAPIFAQDIIAKVLKEIERYNTLFGKPIDDLERRINNCHIRAAKVYNSQATDGKLYTYEEVPFKDGKLPSDLNYPSLKNADDQPIYIDLSELSDDDIEKATVIGAADVDDGAPFPMPLKPLPRPPSYEQTHANVEPRMRALGAPDWAVDVAAGLNFNMEMKLGFETCQQLDRALKASLNVTHAFSSAR